MSIWQLNMCRLPVPCKQRSIQFPVWYIHVALGGMYQPAGFAIEILDLHPCATKLLHQHTAHLLQIKMNTVLD